MEVWEKNNPAVRAAYQIGMPVEAQYTFVHEVGNGTTWLDNYQEFSEEGSLYRYDLRGRMTKALEAIGGVGTYSTTYTFDALDRVVTTTYPTGEAVRTNYDAGGRLASLICMTPYVSGARYNALGQPVQVDFGNTLSVRYRYFGLNVQGVWGLWSKAIFFSISRRI